MRHKLDDDLVNFLVDVTNGVWRAMNKVWEFLVIAVILGSIAWVLGWGIAHLDFFVLALFGIIAICFIWLRFWPRGRAWMISALAKTIHLAGFAVGRWQRWWKKGVNPEVRA